MIQLSARCLALCLAAALLQACKPKAEAPVAEPAPPASAAAASAPTGAADDSPAALMRQVFEGWTGKDADAHLTPALVAAPDAEHRVLVVEDAPSEPSHVAGATVGIYGFERRNGRWFKTFENAELTETGFGGSAGTIKAQPLANGWVALSIENGSCWQGSCAGWLTLFALGATGAQPLASQQLFSDTTGGKLGCEEFLNGKPVEPADKDELTPENCFAIESHWRFEKAAEGGWPDLVLDFEGKETVKDDKTGALTVRPLSEQLVLRGPGANYQPLRGRNPTRGF